jgi:hypothetical protein
VSSGLSVQLPTSVHLPEMAKKAFRLEGLLMHLARRPQIPDLVLHISKLLRKGLRHLFMRLLLVDQLFLEGAAFLRELGA